MKKLLSIAFIGTLLLGVGLSIKKEEKLKSAFDVEIGAVSYFNAGPILKEFKRAEISNRYDKVIDVAINSGGGGVHLGLEFVEEMKSLKSKGTLDAPKLGMHVIGGPTMFERQKNS